MNVASPDRLRFGIFEFDCRNRLLYRGGQELALPPRAVGVLACLLARGGEVVSKQDLLDEVWKEANVTETSLAEAVSLLRQALADDPQRPTFIQTLPRRGYRFVYPLSSPAGAANGAGVREGVSAESGSGVAAATGTTADVFAETFADSVDGRSRAAAGRAAASFPAAAPAAAAAAVAAAPASSASVGVGVGADIDSSVRAGASDNVATLDGLPLRTSSARSSGLSAARSSVHTPAAVAVPSPAPIAAPDAADPVWPAWLPWALLTAVSFALLVVLGITAREPSRIVRPVARFTLALPADLTLAADAPAIALSADGRRVAFIAARAGAPPRIFIRDLDQLEPAMLADTDDAAAPFFSPDGNWVGFFARGRLRKTPVGGGPVETICLAPHPFGATWTPDGSIIFASSWTGGLQRVSDDGGDPVSLTTPDTASGEMRHAWPDLLPDGRGVLFASLSGGDAPETARVAVLSLTERAIHPLFDAATFPRFVSTGHLLFTRGDTVFAAPFDTAALDVLGPAAPVLEGLRLSSARGAAQLVTTRAGTLLTATTDGADAADELRWFDARVLVSAAADAGTRTGARANAGAGAAGFSGAGTASFADGSAGAGVVGGAEAADDIETLVHGVPALGARRNDADRNNADRNGADRQDAGASTAGGRGGGAPREPASGIGLFRVRRADAARGVAIGWPFPARFLRALAVSGDGTRVAASLGDGHRTDIWVSDLPNGVASRVTSSGQNVLPHWTPDHRLIFSARRDDGAFNLFVKSPDDASAAMRLTHAQTSQFVTSASSPAGAIFVQADPRTGLDLWLMPWSGGAPRALVRTAQDETAGALSPDGRWLAYQVADADTGDWRLVIRAADIGGWREPGAARRIDTDAADKRAKSGPPTRELEPGDGSRGASADAARRAGTAADAASRADERVTPLAIADGTWTAWSSDGRALLFVRDGRLMRLALSFDPGGAPSAASDSPSPANESAGSGRAPAAVQAAPAIGGRARGPAGAASAGPAVDADAGAVSGAAAASTFEPRPPRAAGPPEMLADASRAARGYAVSADNRVLVAARRGAAPPTRLEMVLEWSRELSLKVPVQPPPLKPVR